MARCEHILVNSNTKGGPCCSASIDLNIGCSNKCESCYGKKVSMLPVDQFHTDHPIEKVYDDKKFRQSAKRFVNKGVEYARCGKFSDITSGNVGGTYNQVLKSASELGLRLICVSKSLRYNNEIAQLLKEGGHTLHMSLGMISQAQSNFARQLVYAAYKGAGVNAKLRIVEDMTVEMPEKYLGFNDSDVILTPLRLNSKADCEIYNINMENYEFNKGYYRPKFMHGSWKVYSNVCGEVDGGIRCCSCLVGEREEN